MTPGPSGFTPEARAHLDALTDLARRFRALQAFPHIGNFQVTYNLSDPRTLLERHDKAAVDAITKGMDDQAGVLARLAVHYAGMVSKGWTEVGPEPTLARTHPICRDFRALAAIAARMAALVPPTASDEEAERAWLMELRTRGYYSEWRPLAAPAEASAQLCGALSADALARSMTPREASALRPPEAAAPTPAAPVVLLPPLNTKNERRAAIAAFLAAAQEKWPHDRLIKTHCWKAMGYKHAREFQRWQQASKKAGKECSKRCRDLLKMTPQEFIDRLRMKGLLSEPPEMR
jgi:hypothetical protein